MAQFEGQYEETFVVNVPIDRARAHFSDLKTVAAAHSDLERHEIDGQLLRLVFQPKSALGATFQARYQSHYQFSAENVLEWRSTGKDDNSSVEGRAEFTALDASRTRISYKHRMVCEIPINRLLGKAIAPIVASNIRKGVTEYLERMKAGLK